MPDIEPDLEKVRDEKCIPVTRAILKEMATGLVASDSSQVTHTDLIMKSLSLFLSSDLNITTDTPYVPQLILGVLAGLNTTVHSCQVIPIDDARYSVIAGKILSIVSDANVRLGSVKPEESAEDFSPVKEKLNKLFADEKLTLLELKYIMDNIFDAFKDFQEKLGHSIDDSVKRAEQKLFKVEAMSDVTMKQLNDVLTAK